MKHFHSYTNVNLILLNLMLITCESAQSLNFVFPGQEQQRHSSDPELHKKKSSENSPRLMLIDLSALSTSAGNFGGPQPPSMMKLVDLSALSRNPDPRLPVVQATFPDPWDVNPVFPHVLVPAGRVRPHTPISEYDNMLVEEDIYGNLEEKKPVEPNAENNEIMIFPDIDSKHVLSLPVYGRGSPRRRDQDAHGTHETSEQEVHKMMSLIKDREARKSRLLSILLGDLVERNVADSAGDGKDDDDAQAARIFNSQSDYAKK